MSDWINGCGRSARRVVQSMKSGRVRLKPPFRKGEALPEVEINVVLVEEINPPEGEKPISWLLLTSLPVDTFEPLVGQASSPDIMMTSGDACPTLSCGGILPLPLADRDIF
ncbi:MAG TPA: hypothetical protein VJ440_02195 [Candidatus Brocadiaceae bacterium]|nr:hypothetical protein [Candidatus Brocadiaceae bacterium]